MLKTRLERKSWRWILGSILFISPVLGIVLGVLWRDVQVGMGVSAILFATATYLKELLDFVAE